VEAATETRTPLVRVERGAWAAADGDRWCSVESMSAAALALGGEPRRVFLSVGRQEVAAFAAAPQHDYLVRAIDRFDPALPRARVIAARGPFALDDELALLRREAIEIVVSKNSGTPATYAKIEAARRLGLPVVMIERPQLPAAATVDTVDGVLSWLHDALLEPRGA
jgi:precorrin-6A/cobalt-precorrin-6A reductase